MSTFTQVRDFDLTTGKQWEIGSKFSFAECTIWQDSNRAATLWSIRGG